MNNDTTLAEVQAERTELAGNYMELWALRKKFHDAAAELYPNVRYPELCWLFDQVLKIDPRVISEQPITKKKYKVFILDEDGKRQVNPDTHQAFEITREFTAQQRKAVREWWALLPEAMMGE